MQTAFHDRTRRAGYQPTYRAREVRSVARWMLEGTSGAVIGMGGAGKSNFLRFLCTQPDALRAHWPADADLPVIVMVDLNDLPAGDLATFYRVLLRAFYEARGRLDPRLEAEITALFRDARATTDAFVAQTALRELLFALVAGDGRVVMVLDRFDRFCETATPELTDTLRGLRDACKGRLSYLMGMRQEVAFVDDPGVLGELYEILDTHVCWIGPMAPDDARQVLAEETSRAAVMPSDDDVSRLLALTGGYPALMKAACHWWLDRGPVAAGRVGAAAGGAGDGQASSAPASGSGWSRSSTGSPRRSFWRWPRCSGLSRGPSACRHRARSTPRRSSGWSERRATTSPSSTRRRWHGWSVAASSRATKGPARGAWSVGSWRRTSRARPCRAAASCGATRRRARCTRARRRWSAWRTSSAGCWSSCSSIPASAIPRPRSSRRSGPTRRSARG